VILDVRAWENGSLNLSLESEPAVEDGKTTKLNFEVVLATTDMLARYEPVAGDYYVLHDDGFASVLSKSVFEKFYRVA
jgi:hypothetical protein